MGRIRFALLACLALVMLTVVAAAHAQSPEPRVVGGSGTTIEEYPWQAAVVTAQADHPSLNTHERQFCGGSLLTASIVITAAHCVADGDPDCTPATCALSTPVCTPASDPPPGDGTCKLDPDDLDVVLGVTTLSTATAEQELAVQDVSHHLSFDDDTLQYDVGYLVLSAPVVTGPTIQTIDIAGDDEAAVWAPEVFQEVSGWGYTEEGGETVDSLRAASVPIVDDTTCRDGTDYGSLFDETTMVCAGFLEGEVDTCNGDSGGPLEAPLEGGGYRLIGITSWGFGCAQPDAPGVYTRIAEAAPGGLRDDVVTKVDQLELAFTLADEPIVGSLGQPSTSGPKYPPPTPGGKSGGGLPEGATAIPVATANDPYLKCKKLKQKTKRKRCNRKVRASLGQ
jgi:secreted trypsin-like serine protease